MKKILKVLAVIAVLLILLSTSGVALLAFAVNSLPH